MYRYHRRHETPIPVGAAASPRASAPPTLPRCQRRNPPPSRSAQPTGARVHGGRWRPALPAASEQRPSKARASRRGTPSGASRWSCVRGAPRRCTSALLFTVSVGRSVTSSGEHRGPQYTRPNTSDDRSRRLLQVRLLPTSRCHRDLDRHLPRQSDAARLRSVGLGRTISTSAGTVDPAFAVSPSPGPRGVNLSRDNLPSTPNRGRIRTRRRLGLLVPRTAGRPHAYFIRATCWDRPPPRGRARWNGLSGWVMETAQPHDAPLLRVSPTSRSKTRTLFPRTPPYPMTPSRRLLTRTPPTKLPWSSIATRQAASTPRGPPARNPDDVPPSILPGIVSPFAAGRADRPGLITTCAPHESVFHCCALGVSPGGAGRGWREALASCRLLTSSPGKPSDSRSAARRPGAGGALRPGVGDAHHGTLPRWSTCSTLLSRVSAIS